MPQQRLKIPHAAANTWHRVIHKYIFLKIKKCPPPKLYYPLIWKLSFDIDILNKK